MASIHSNSYSLRILLLLFLSQIVWIHGFTAGGRCSSSPPQLTELGSQKNDSSDAKIEVSDDHKTDEMSTRNTDRRLFLSHLASSTLAGGSALLLPTQNANAIPFIGGSDRRQLELCLVTILRTEYWAINVSKSLKTKLLTPTTNNGDGDELSEIIRKQPYLEARLGAKALLTQKIGGGANSRVEVLGGFQLKECVQDSRYWCGELAKSNQLPSQLAGETSTKNAKRICTDDLVTAGEEIIESLGSLVEFDGLETTVDPSPRSSLMLNMYNPSKGAFVYRTLVERVVPSCERYLDIFGKDRRRLIDDFVRRDHGEEVPFEVLEKLYGD
ncbi:hypothetical protein ACHAXR_005376 [Thalassiosira sp. AJA248-18]